MIRGRLLHSRAGQRLSQAGLDFMLRVGRRTDATAPLRMLRHPEWHYTGRTLRELPRTTYRAADPSTLAALALCTRIAAAWRSSREDPATASLIWEGIHSRQAAALTIALDAGDAVAIRGLLASMFDQPFIVGIALGDLVHDPRIEATLAIPTLDKLASLAEWLGVVDVENPDDGVPGRIAADQGELVRKVEAAAGVSLEAPAIGAAYGVQIGGRLVTAETPEHLYAALRLHRAIEAAGLDPTASVLEVGGGFAGTAAWYLRTEPAPTSYTLIDLPHASVLQAYYLGSLLGADAIQLAGESREARIRILPPSALEGVTADVLFNQNSMPEMTAAAVREYLEWGRSRAKLIYSYNHEARTVLDGVTQAVVPDVARELGLRLVSRNHSWIRRGYVEEIYLPG